MAYPFAGFGSFRFKSSERPILGTDTHWTRKAATEIEAALGSSVDDVQVMAPRSERRVFEILLTRARITELKALHLTTGEFVDWDEPVPGQRTAFLDDLDPGGEEQKVVCDDGTSEFRRRVRLGLIDQTPTA